jgi:hypothetical protein
VHYWASLLTNHYFGGVEKLLIVCSYVTRNIKCEVLNEVSIKLVESEGFCQWRITLRISGFVGFDHSRFSNYLEFQTLHKVHKPSDSEFYKTGYTWIIPSSRRLCHVALIGTDVSEERSSSIIRETRIDGLGTTLALTNDRRTLRVTANIVPSSLILVTLMMEALRSSETSVLTRATWRNTPEDRILRSHRRENL